MFSKISKNMLFFEIKIEKCVFFLKNIKKLEKKIGKCQKKVEKRVEKKEIKISKIENFKI